MALLLVEWWCVYLLVWLGQARHIQNTCYSGGAPPEVRESTSLATKPVRAIRISTQDGQLQEVDPDQLDQIIADTVAKGGVFLEKRFIQTL